MSKPRLAVVDGREPSSASWWTLWSSFEKALKAKKPNANTARTYHHGAECLLGYLSGQGRPTDPAAITRDDLRGWLGWMQESGKAPATADVYYSAVRSFFRWALTEEEIDVNPCDRVVGPVVPEKPADMISAEDMAKLLAACSGRTFADRRDAALFRIAYDTGLRRTELARIAVEDVDDEAGVIAITGKGGRLEAVYIGAKSVAAIDRYMRVRRAHPKAGTTVERSPGEFVHPLWLSPAGALHPQSLQAILQKRADMAGLGRHLHMHSFRHGFAHSMKAAGASDEDVQRLGRWRDPRVMARYGRAARDERARATHRRLSPGDRV